VGHKDAAAAVAEYRLFLSDHPPTQWVSTAASFIRQAFAQDHQPLPSGVPTT
jgi:hypothetical protein